MAKRYQLWAKTEKDNFYSINIEFTWTKGGLRILEIVNMKNHEKLQSKVYSDTTSIGTLGEVFKNKKDFVNGAVGYYLSNNEKIIAIAELIKQE